MADVLSYVIARCVTSVPQLRISRHRAYGPTYQVLDSIWKPPNASRGGTWERCRDGGGNSAQAQCQAQCARLCPTLPSFPTPGKYDGPLFRDDVLGLPFNFAAVPIWPRHLAMCTARISLKLTVLLPNGAQRWSTWRRSHSGGRRSWTLAGLTKALQSPESVLSWLTGRSQCAFGWADGRRVAGPGTELVRARGLFLLRPVPHGCLEGGLH